MVKGDTILLALWSLALLLTIPLVLYLGLDTASEQKNLYPANSVDENLRTFAITVASISAGAGSVIIVFIAFISEQVGRPSVEPPMVVTPDLNPRFDVLYRTQWYRARLKMMMINCIIGICALIINTLVTLVAVFYRFPVAEWTG